jgi:hypothetical protein
MFRDGVGAEAVEQGSLFGAKKEVLLFVEYVREG